MLFCGTYLCATMGNDASKTLSKKRNAAAYSAVMPDRFREVSYYIIDGGSRTVSRGVTVDDVTKMPLPLMSMFSAAATSVSVADVEKLPLPFGPRPNELPGTMAAAGPSLQPAADTASS